MQPKGLVKNKGKINKTKQAEKTRKQLRKEKRLQKKINKAAYYLKKKSKNQPNKSFEKLDQLSATSDNKSRIDGGKQVKAGPTKAQNRKRTREERAEKNAKKQRMQQLKQANLQEDKMIKQLEKRLKLNKRKSKSVPKSFVSDGLDCILYNFYNFQHIVH